MLFIALVVGTGGSVRSQSTDEHSGIRAVEMPLEVQFAGRATVVPGTRYRMGSIGEFFFGKAYRDIWATEVELPVIDLEKTAGGLTVDRLGGGKQTRSLHLKGADGNDYMLRSLDKDVTLVFPPRFRGTIVHYAAQHQTAAAHPFAAEPVAELAMAGGILHVVPKLVVVPDSPRLGAFREDFAGMIAWFEKRPDEDQSDDPRLGNARNVVGFEKLIEEITEDNDRRVDENAFARARLFDMLIGDWDRHDDQWRWAEFDKGDTRWYVPVPRDRDFAFSRFDGALTSLARVAQESGIQRLGRFSKDVGNLVGLNFQGAKLDLRFTGSLEREDWVREANALKTSITDDVIRRAVALMPEHARTNPDIAAILRTRRDLLPELAEEYYEKLSKTVDLVGSDKHERFEVDRRSNGDVDVRIVKVNKEGEPSRTLVERLFHNSETSEIRLYGLDGNDIFVLNGRSPDGPRIRVIGGPGDDRFVDQSSVDGSIKRNHFYDTSDGADWQMGSESRLHPSQDTLANQYEMHRYEFDITRPLISLAYNTDDGPFFGGGVRFERAGFRKEPYAAAHSITANVAPITRSYNAVYTGVFPQWRKGWDAELNASVLASGEFRHYYGFGNDTEGTFDVRDRHRPELQWVTLTAQLGRRIAPGLRFAAGPRVQYVSVDPPGGYSPVGRGSAITPEQYIDTYYAGMILDVEVDTRNATRYPLRGIHWVNQASFNAGIRNTENRYIGLGSELAGYFSVSPFTLALRAGGSTRQGDFEFFQGSQVGGPQTLRGYRTGRFTGHTAAYGSAELRLNLGMANIWLARGDAGFFGFFDAGRVWWDGEDSDTIHQGYGGGIFFSPYNALTLTGFVGVSPEEKALLSLGFGFAF